MGALGAFSFEVFGKVQKVYFRDSTVQEAKRLGLVGWVANTLRGTVVGECQGPAAALGEMKVWLREKGSPASVIERAVFSSERLLESLSFAAFERKPGRLP